MGYGGGKGKGGYGGGYGGGGSYKGGGKGGGHYDDDDIEAVGGDSETFVKVTGGDGPTWHTWDQVKEGRGANVKFPAELVDYLRDDAKFEKPTPIQAYCWSILLANSNVVGIAKTGSGKTLAFLLPAFILCEMHKPDVRRNGPAILVMAPTRELANQIGEEATRFGKPVDITTALAYGGAPRNNQKWYIEKGPHCVVGCPGRVKDFIDTGVLRVSSCYYCVLDEADRMLDMGFQPQIE